MATTSVLNCLYYIKYENKMAPIKFISVFCVICLAIVSSSPLPQVPSLGFLGGPQYGGGGVTNVQTNIVNNVNWLDQSKHNIFAISNTLTNVEELEKQVKDAFPSS